MEQPFCTLTWTIDECHKHSPYGRSEEKNAVVMVFGQNCHNHVKMRIIVYTIKKSKVKVHFWIFIFVFLYVVIVLLSLISNLSSAYIIALQFLTVMNNLNHQHVVIDLDNNNLTFNRNVQVGPISPCLPITLQFCFATNYKNWRQWILRENMTRRITKLKWAIWMYIIPKYTFYCHHEFAASICHCFYHQVQKIQSSDN